MTLHEQLTQEIRTGPSGPNVGAFFDLDQTLFAGFSATAFTRDQFTSGRLSPRDLADSLRATLSFAFGRTGFSTFVSATSAVYRGMAESVLEEAGQRTFERASGDRDLSGVPGPGEGAPGDGTHGGDHHFRHTLPSRAGGSGSSGSNTSSTLGSALRTGSSRARWSSRPVTERGRPRPGGASRPSTTSISSESYFYSDSDEDLPLVRAWSGRPRAL